MATHAAHPLGYLLSYTLMKSKVEECADITLTDN